MVTKVVWSKRVEKKLGMLPDIILRKFYSWVNAVSLLGVHEVRKYPGFNDESLKGERNGQRSVRLNKAYRAIYIEHHGELSILEVIEVNKHEY